MNISQRWSSYWMARPKPNILLEHVDKNYNSEQILEASAIFAVYYQGKPINLRTLNTLVNYPGPKYKKIGFQIVVMHLILQTD